MKANVYSAFTTSKTVSCTILIAMLLTAFSLAPVFAQTEGSTVQSYENISVNTAYNMITNGSLPNLVILDVRYQCEYDIGHLYGAILIPYDQLEARIGELEENRNNEIIVYCKSGYRSQIACETLVKYNCTKVYNMLGGILAWIEAGYPIWTTSHYVTVNLVDEEILLQIEPLLVRLSSCSLCVPNQTCSSCSNSLNVTSTVVEQRENYTKILVTYEVNGTSRDITIARTLLQSYKELSDEANRTVNFIFTEVTADNSSTQSYTLNYLVNSVNYNLTIYTTLSTFSPEIYNSSFTIMNYAPIGDSEVTTLEFVEINSSVTLSQLYAVLGKVAKEIGKVYEKSEDESLMPLNQAYSRMNEEAKHLSKLVEKQLLQYNHKILHSSAVIMDMLTLDGDGGGGGSPPPSPSGCDWGCVINCVFQDPELLAHCSFILYACLIWPTPLNPACWLLIACVLVYGIVCALECCWW